MPEDSCGGSVTSNLAGYRLGNPKIKKGLASDCSEKGGSPIVRFARALVEGAMSIIGNSGDTDNNKKRKFESEELKDDFLEKAMERMNEA